MPKSHHLWRIALILAILFGQTSSSKAQGTKEVFGSPSFSNCYQKFVWDVAEMDTLNVRLLNTPGGRFLQFSAQVNPIDISGYEIIYFDENGNQIQSTQVSTFGNIQVPANIPSLQINPINNTGGWAGYYPAIATFVDPLDAFDLTPFNEDCFTYNNFGFNAILNLDGLCKPDLLTYELFSNINGQKIPFGPTELEPGISYSIDGTEFCYPPFQEPCELPPPCPKCTDFTIEITIYPCEEMQTDPNCPPLLIEYPIEICCFCGNESTHNE